MVWHYKITPHWSPHNLQIYTTFNIWLEYKQAVKGGLSVGWEGVCGANFYSQISISQISHWLASLRLAKLSLKYIGATAKWPNHVHNTMLLALDGNVLHCVQCITRHCCKLGLGCSMIVWCNHVLCRGANCANERFTHATGRRILNRLCKAVTEKGPLKSHSCPMHHWTYKMMPASNKYAALFYIF